MTHAQPAPESSPLKVELGRLLITPSALKELNHEDVLTRLDRHLQGVAPQLSDEAEAARRSAFQGHPCTLSTHSDRNGVQFWIITETKIKMTIVVLPREVLSF